LLGLRTGLRIFTSNFFEFGKRFGGPIRFQTAAGDFDKCFGELFGSSTILG
jgi:hypothetical protein